MTPSRMAFSRRTKGCRLRRRCAPSMAHAPAAPDGALRALGARCARVFCFLHKYRMCAGQGTSSTAKHDGHKSRRRTQGLGRGTQAGVEPSALSRIHALPLPFLCASFNGKFITGVKICADKDGQRTPISIQIDHLLGSATRAAWSHTRWH